MNRKILATGACLLWTALGAAWAAPHDIKWTEGTTNPVTSEPGFGDNRTYYASVLYDASAGRYRIWYDASSGADIGYGESVGDDPTKFGNYQRVTGIPAGGSKGHVVQLDANTFRMWYEGPGGGTPGYEVRTAISRDGVNWTEDVPCLGIVKIDANSKGPNEHFAVCRRRDGLFYALAETDALDEEEGIRDARMNAYTSTDGITWTLQGPVEIGVANITSIIDHPDRPSTLYAFGYANDQTTTSHVSTDGGKTWQDDESPINTVGEAGMHDWNVDRNYNPQAIYRGAGRWLLFRTVAEPKRTAYATGVESGVPGP